MPPEPTPGLPEVLMSAISTLEPVFEAGAGLRAKLEAEGWSPTVAESVAHQLISAIITKMFAG